MRKTNNFLLIILAFEEDQQLLRKAGVYREICHFLSSLRRIYKRLCPSISPLVRNFFQSDLASYKFASWWILEMCLFNIDDNVFSDVLDILDILDISDVSDIFEYF